MADNATLFKLVAKSVGISRGVLPTFMAKPWGNVNPRLWTTRSLILTHVFM
jgi:glutamine synthetase